MWIVRCCLRHEALSYLCCNEDLSVPGSQPCVATCPWQGSHGPNCLGFLPSGQCRECAFRHEGHHFIGQSFGPRIGSNARIPGQCYHHLWIRYPVWRNLAGQHTHIPWWKRMPFYPSFNTCIKAWVLTAVLHGQQLDAVMFSALVFSISIRDSYVSRKSWIEWLPSPQALPPTRMISSSVLTLELPIYFTSVLTSLAKSMSPIIEMPISNFSSIFF